MTALERYIELLTRLDQRISAIQRQRSALDAEHQKLVDRRAVLMQLLIRGAKMRAGKV